MPSTTSLVLLDANNNGLAQVGTASGSGTGITKYKAGRVYTAIASRICSSANADSKLKVFLFINK